MLVSHCHKSDLLIIAVNANGLETPIGNYKVSCVFFDGHMLTNCVIEGDNIRPQCTK